MPTYQGANENTEERLFSECNLAHLLGVSTKDLEKQPDTFQSTPEGAIKALNFHASKAAAERRLTEASRVPTPASNQLASWSHQTGPQLVLARI
jgi:hypothetical protein